MDKLIKIFLLSLILVLIAGIQSAHAIAQLKLSDGTTTILIVDGNQGGYESYYTEDAFHLIGVDTDPDDGEVTYEKAYEFGDTDLRVAAGVTYPNVGSLEFPQMHLNTSFTTLTPAGGILDVWFTEIGFGVTELPTLKTFSMSAGGTSVGYLNFNANVDDTNTEFGTGVEIGNIGSFEVPLGPGPYHGDTTGTYFATMPFSMTIHATINNTSIIGPSGLDLDVTTVVPEPVSSVLFLTGGAVFGIRRFRRKG